MIVGTVKMVRREFDPGHILKMALKIEPTAFAHRSHVGGEKVRVMWGFWFEPLEEWNSKKL